MIIKWNGGQKGIYWSVDGQNWFSFVGGSYATATDEIIARAQAVNPTYFDVLPLSLEEIFIYELGGVNYEVKNIVL